MLFRGEVFIDTYKPVALYSTSAIWSVVHPQPGNLPKAIVNPDEREREILIKSRLLRVREVSLRTGIIAPCLSTGQVRAILCHSGFSTFEYLQSPMVKPDSCRIPHLIEKIRSSFDTFDMPLYRCRSMNGESAAHFWHTPTNAKYGSSSFSRSPWAPKVSFSSGAIFAKFVSAYSGFDCQTMYPSYVNIQICCEESVSFLACSWTPRPSSVRVSRFFRTSLPGVHVNWTFWSVTTVNASDGSDLL